MVKVALGTNTKGLKIMNFSPKGTGSQKFEIYVSKSNSKYC